MIRSKVKKLKVSPYVELMVLRIGPKWYNCKLDDAIGPIRDIIKLTVVAKGIERRNPAKSKPCYLAGDGSVGPSCKSGEQSP